MHKWLIALLVLPLASAQVPTAAFEIAVDGPEFLVPDGATSFNVAVTVGCLEVIENSGEADVLVSATAMAGVEAQPVELHFGIEDCIGEESITKNTTLDLVATGAPGLVPFTATFTALLGDHAVEAALEERMVAYLPGHTMTPSGNQTFDVTGPTYEFDLDLNITANAKTMVMFENKVVSGTASLTGLKANIFDVPAGERQLTNQVTFYAPDSAWTQETVTFYTYSHCLGGPDCGENFARTITWTFVNVGGDPVATENSSEEAPGLGLPILLAGLVLAAVGVARRRS